MSYWLGEDAQALVRQLVDREPAHEHLDQARIACIMSAAPLTLRGAPAAAFVGKPTIQGPMRDLFEWAIVTLTVTVTGPNGPDFVVMFDASHWRDLDATQRERLVYHELKHIQQVVGLDGCPKFNKQTGAPILKTVPHDTEVFHDEVRRYGPDVCELGEHVAALTDGTARARRARLQLLKRPG